MPIRDTYELALRKLVYRLTRRALTARQIMELFECSKPVAYSRLAELIARGYVFEIGTAASSGSGPRAYTYRITSNPG